MIRRSDTWTPFALLSIAFLAAHALVLATAGPAFLSSDERFAYVQSHAHATTAEGVYTVPYANTVGAAFVAMGSGTSGKETVEGGVSPLFVAVLSPFAALGPWGAHAGSVFFGWLLVLGVFLFARETMTPRVAVLASAMTAASLPVAFWSTFFMANVPTVALFVLAMWALARLATTRSLAWAALSILLVTLTVGMRRDSLPLVVPLLVVLVVLAKRQPALGGFFLLAVYLAIASYRIAVGLASDVRDAWLMSTSDVRAALESLVGRFAGYHVDSSWQDLASQTERLALGLYPILVVVALIGVFGLRRCTGPRRQLMIALLMLMGLAYLWTAMTITAAIFHDPPGAFSSLVRYALVGTVAVGILAAMSAPIAVHASSGRSSRVAVGALALLLVGPTALHTALAEPGLLWAAEQRSWRHDIDQRASKLPENAYLIGDEVSKYVTSRLVLSGDHAYKPLDLFLPVLVDRLADRHGLRGFVHHDTFHGDWWGAYGEYVTDANHTTIEWLHDLAFFEIVYTNASLANLGVLSAGDWRIDEEGFLRSLSNVSFFQPTPNLGQLLRDGPAPALHVTLRYQDVAEGVHSFGYVNAPHTANDRRTVHTWTGSGSGNWQTVEIFLPTDTTTNGRFFVSGGLRLAQLQLTPMPGLVQP